MKPHTLLLLIPLLLVALSAWPAAAMAQSKEFTLTGTISMQTGEQFPYKLVLTEAGGKAAGYAITFSDPEETRATVKAVIDRQMQTISFRETGIIVAHTHHTRAYMCLVNALLEVQQGAAGKVLAGTLVNKDAGNVACTQGVITFSSPGEISRIFSYNDEVDTVIVMKKKAAASAAPVTAAATVAAAPLAVTEKITTGIQKTIDWHSDTLVIDLWDGGDVDGDRVTLLLNGRPLLERYYLVKAKKQLRVAVPGNGIYTLAILAENEGNDPPNTASLLLTDGGVIHSVLAYNNKGSRAEIKIKKLVRQ